MPSAGDESRNYYSPTLMAAPQPRTRAGRRRRRRRGSVERPVSARIYRATWTLVALPLLVAAFTVGRPAALPATALPPSFDEATAAQVAEDFSRLFPDRRPGTPGAEDAAVWVTDRLGEYDFVVETRPFDANVPGLGDVELANLVARTAGDSERGGTIVVLAHRDNTNLSRGRNDNGSGTAALIELARNLSTVSLAHSIVFVSADGGAYGNLGAAELAADPAFTEGVLAVVNLDALAGSGRPRLELAGDRPRSPSGELLATADAAVLEQTGARAAHTGAFGQLLDLAFPFSFYGQSPFLADGDPAVTLTSAGDRPPKPSQDVAATFDPQTLGTLGRAAQRVIGSLDEAAEIASGSDSGIYLGGRFVRGFAIQLFLVIAILPPLLATLDLAARVVRRGADLGPAARSFFARLAAWASVGAVAVLFSAIGLFPNGAARPLNPDTGPGVEWPLGALLGFAVVSCAIWLIVRPRLLPSGPVARAEEVAGHLVVMLALSAIAVGLAIANPYSTLFVLPALHAWLWIPHVRAANPAVRIALYLVGFAGPIVLLISFAVRFELGFDAPWYVAALFSVGYAPLSLFVAFLAFGAAAGQAAAILFGRYAPYLVTATGRASASGESDEAHFRSGRELASAARDENEGVRLRGRHDHV
jgi:Peptidase family M28